MWKRISSEQVASAGAFMLVLRDIGVLDIMVFFTVYKRMADMRIKTVEDENT
jgi:hypothetical protein